MLLFAQTQLGDMVEVDAGAIGMLEKDLIGSYIADITLQQPSADLIFSRAITVRDLITHRFPLEEINTAIDVTSMKPGSTENSLKVMVNL